MYTCKQALQLILTSLEPAAAQGSGCSDYPGLSTHSPAVCKDSDPAEPLCDQLVLQGGAPHLQHSRVLAPSFPFSQVCIEVDLLSHPSNLPSSYRYRGRPVVPSFPVSQVHTDMPQGSPSVSSITYTHAHSSPWGGGRAVSM